MAARRARHQVPKSRIPKGVDLEACPCVDGGHWFDTENAVYHRKIKGQLKGLAVRTTECIRCRSSKDQIVMWDGRVGQPVYDHDEAYIENARALSDDMHERPRMYRAEMLRRADLPALEDEDNVVEMRQSA